MKILISAYACEPDRGSEPEVGLQILLAAAREHEVWVITRENNLPALSSYLLEHPFESRIHLIGLDLSERALRWKRKGGLVGLHMYHDAWQRRLGAVAQVLDAEVGFDLVHHATFATYWTRAGVAKVDKPMVWGPIGGGATTPVRLMPSLGSRGMVEELARSLLRPLVAIFTGAKRTANRSELVLCQNPETASRLGGLGNVRILPNSIAVVSNDLDQLVERVPGRLVAAGRLIPLKGYHLLIAAMKNLPDYVVLDIYGDGPERPRLERIAQELEVGDRVRFRGQVTRPTFLKEVMSGSVFVHPALHEESGLVVAEALAAGLPLVAFDRGGPPVVASHFRDSIASMVDLGTRRESVDRLAGAVADLLTRPANARIPGVLSTPFSDALLDFYSQSIFARG